MKLDLNTTRSMPWRRWITKVSYGFTYELKIQQTINCKKCVDI